MSYILKNIKTTVRSTPLICILFLVCEVVSILVILFSQGVYNNYQIKTNIDEIPENHQYGMITFGKVINKEEIPELNITNYNASGYTTVGEFKKVLNILSEDVKESFSGFYADYYIGGYWSMMRIEYQPDLKGYGLSKTFVNSTPLACGRMISQEEEIAGDLVCVVPYSYNGRDALNQTIDISNKTYTIIGVKDEYNGGTNTYDIPFASISDDITIRYIDLNADMTITTHTWRKIVEAFTKVYGDDVNFPEFETADVTEITFYKSVMLIAIALSVLCSINLAILFRYILNTRRKTLAVFCLAGCTKRKAKLMYLSEITGISTIIFVICSLIYQFLIMPNLTFAFEHIQKVYSFEAYLYIFLAFIITLIVVIEIMVTRFIKKTPVLMLRKEGA